MSFLFVPNLDRWQHYKDRCPPWIKLHRDTLRDYKFACLPDASKAHLIQIWLLASQVDNKIPDDHAWISKQINATSKIDIKYLLNQGFLQRDIESLADCKQSALVETETETETEEDIPYFSFSHKFYIHLSDQHNGKKKVSSKIVTDGAHTVDKLVRIDEYDFESEIRPALRWAITDVFWSSQVRSLVPLRKRSKNGETKFANLFNAYTASMSGGSSKSPSGTCLNCAHIRECNGKTIKSPACGRYDGGVVL